MLDCISDDGTGDGTGDYSDPNDTYVVQSTGNSYSQYDQDSAQTQQQSDNAQLQAAQMANMQATTQASIQDQVH